MLIGENMNLREYLILHRMSIREFGEKINYSKNYINGMLNGRYIPSKKLAKIIEKETNGEVKSETWFSKDSA